MHHLDKELLRAYNLSSCEFWIIITTLVKWQSERVVTRTRTQAPFICRKIDESRSSVR